MNRAKTPLRRRAAPFYKLTDGGVRCLLPDPEAVRGRGKVLFINAVREVARERALSSLTAEHQKRIFRAYRAFAEDVGFAAVASSDEILANDGNLSIPRYVKPIASIDTNITSDGDLPHAWADFDAGSAAFWRQMDDVVEMLDRVVADGTSDG